jgi:hypothetical protein
MPHLKSRTQHPPYSFRFLQPETGQTKEFEGSFNHVVEQTIILRKANSFLAERHGWSMETVDVENEVDAYNTARCIAGGWTDFLVMDDAPAYAVPIQKKTNRSAGVAALGSVKRVAAGVALLVEWLGSGAKAVDQPLAESRAAICSTCPRNDGGDFTAYFTAPIADKIRTQMEIRGDLQLRTSHDERLTVCSACDCPLKLKVHVPLNHILAHISADTKTRLAPQCWITAETNAGTLR